PHPWDVTIDATDGDRDGWAGIGGLARDDADTLQSRLAPRGTWVFPSSPDGARDGWAGIGGLARDDADTFQSVLDRGDTWIFRFAYGGEEAELRISRQHLEQTGWHVSAPADVL